MKFGLKVREGHKIIQVIIEKSIIMMVFNIFHYCLLFDFINLLL